MSLANFRIEGGIRITDTNSDLGVDQLQGSGAPAGTSGATDSADIGSTYQDRTNGQKYYKLTSTSSAVDWQKFADEGVYSLIGTSFDAADMGTYTGSTVADGGDVKDNIQDLETALEAINGGASSENTNVTSSVVLDSCLVDACQFIEWEVFMVENGTANRQAIKITAIHDGTSAADATATDYSKHTKLRMGSNNAFTYDVTLSGVGVAQVIELTVSASNASTFQARRTDVL